MTSAEVDSEGLLDGCSKPPVIVNGDAETKCSSINIAPRLKQRHGVWIGFDPLDRTETPDTGRRAGDTGRDAIAIEPAEDFGLVAKHPEAVDDGDSALGADDVCQGPRLAIANAIIEAVAERIPKSVRRRPTDTRKALVCGKMADDRLATGDQGERHYRMQLRAKFRMQPHLASHAPGFTDRRIAWCSFRRRECATELAALVAADDHMVAEAARVHRGDGQLPGGRLLRTLTKDRGRIWSSKPPRR